MPSSPSASWRPWWRQTSSVVTTKILPAFEGTYLAVWPMIPRSTTASYERCGSPRDKKAYQICTMVYNGICSPMEDLKKLIREVPDFPKPGILFYDITTLLKDKTRVPRR